MSSNTEVEMKFIKDTVIDADMRIIIEAFTNNLNHFDNFQNE